MIFKLILCLLLKASVYMLVGIFNNDMSVTLTGSNDIESNSIFSTKTREMSQTINFELDNKEACLEILSIFDKSTNDKLMSFTRSGSCPSQILSDLELPIQFIEYDDQFNIPVDMGDFGDPDTMDEEHMTGVLKQVVTPPSELIMASNTSNWRHNYSKYPGLSNLNGLSGQSHDNHLTFKKNTDSFHRKYNDTRRWVRENPYSLVKNRIDPGVHGGVIVSYQEIFFEPLHKIDSILLKPKRAGVIIYSQIQDQLLFAMGIDSSSGNITDFGGTVEYNKDKRAINGGLRELKEESQGVFGNLNPNQIQDCLTAYSEEMMISFIHLTLDPIKITSEFNQKVSKCTDPEIEEIVWLNKNQLFNLINSGKIELDGKVIHMYDVVHKFLQKLTTKYGDFSKKL